MLGLNLPKLVAPETDLNLARVVGEAVAQTEQNRVPPHHSSTETAEPSFGNRRFCVRRGGQLY
jgi:hypothetical protein